MQERSYRGHFEVYGNPQFESGGVVEFSEEDGITLELFDTGSIAPRFNESDSVEQIIGTESGGNPVRLHKCSSLGRSSNYKTFGSASPERYRCREMFVGYPFKNNNPAFDRVDLHQTFLSDWADLSRAFVDNSDLSIIPSVEPGDQIKLAYEFPEIPSTVIGDVEIKLSVRTNTNFKNARGGGISVETYWQINPRRPQVPFNEFKQIIGKLQDFVSFGMGKPTSTEKIVGKVNYSRGVQDVPITYQPASSFKDSSAGHPKNTLFQFKDIEERFGSVLNTWFKKSEVLAPVFNLYFATQYNEGMYTQNAFLSLTQAIETYHRRTTGGRYIDSEEYNQVHNDLNRFLEEKLSDEYSLENDFKMHLKRGTFKYANEYSLRKRLSMIVDEHEDVLEDLPLNIVERQKQIIDTRNYLTHYDEKKDAVTGEEQILLVWGLEQLLEVCLLSEIKIPKEHIKERLFNQYRYRGIAYGGT